MDTFSKMWRKHVNEVSNPLNGANKVMRKDVGNDFKMRA